MTVVHKVQDSSITFRANDLLVSALLEQARRSGCSTSEYLRAIVRERVGLQ
jgi:hypothetical protein